MVFISHCHKHSFEIRAKHVLNLNLVGVNTSSLSPSTYIFFFPVIYSLKSQGATVLCVPWLVGDLQGCVTCVLHFPACWYWNLEDRRASSCMFSHPALHRWFLCLGDVTSYSQRPGQNHCYVRATRALSRDPPRSPVRWQVETQEMRFLLSASSVEGCFPRPRSTWGAGWGLLP